MEMIVLKRHYLTPKLNCIYVFHIKILQSIPNNHQKTLFYFVFRDKFEDCHAPHSVQTRLTEITAAEIIFILINVKKTSGVKEDTVSRIKGAVHIGGLVVARK